MINLSSVSLSWNMFILLLISFRFASSLYFKTLFTEKYSKVARKEIDFREAVARGFRV